MYTLDLEDLPRALPAGTKGYFVKIPAFDDMQARTPLVTPDMPLGSFDWRDLDTLDDHIQDVLDKHTFSDDELLIIVFTLPPTPGLPPLLVSTVELLDDGEGAEEGDDDDDADDPVQGTPFGNDEGMGLGTPGRPRRP